MAELAKHGGRRTGSGRPSAHAQKTKQDASKSKTNAREAKRQAALEAAQEHVEQAAAAGERWAIEMLMAYEIGKPGTKVTSTPDTEINLITRFPRGAFACPHCHKEISEIRPLGANLGSRDSILGEAVLVPIQRDSEVGMEHEEAGTDDDSDDPGGRAPGAG